MTSQVLNKLLVIGAAAAALSVAACSKPATSEADNAGAGNTMAASATNDVTNTSANTAGAMNTATNTGG